jgi:hypothetical protein
MRPCPLYFFLRTLLDLAERPGDSPYLAFCLGVRYPAFLLYITIFVISARMSICRFYSHSPSQLFFGIQRERCLQRQICFFGLGWHKTGECPMAHAASHELCHTLSSLEDYLGRYPCKGRGKVFFSFYDSRGGKSRYAHPNRTDVRTDDYCLSLEQSGDQITSGYVTQQRGNWTKVQRKYRRVLIDNNKKKVIRPLAVVRRHQSRDLTVTVKPICEGRKRPKGYVQGILHISSR